MTGEATSLDSAPGGGGANPRVETRILVRAAAVTPASPCPGPEEETGDPDVEPVDQVRLLTESGQFHSRWYSAVYQDRKGSGLSAAEHYLRIGAILGRNPRAGFDRAHYLATYPEVAARGMEPAIHYAQEGRALGYAIRPGPPPAQQEMERIRTCFLSLGVQDGPPDELHALLARTTDPELRVAMMLEIGLWLQRPGPRQDHAASAAWLERADRLAAETARAMALAGQILPAGLRQAARMRIAAARLIGCHLAGRNDEGLKIYEEAALNGLATADLLLARGNFEPMAERRLAWINEALAAYDLPGLRLGAPADPSLPEPDALPYDRLSLADPAACPAVGGGPRVSVLVATHAAAGTIRTALRALGAQTWQNLEVIVLDDCGPQDGTRDIVEELSARDPRFRYVRMETNGGAYVARNRGLQLATGDYVTLHDADDWSHPRKIETQVRYMEAHPEVMGCTSEQARMGEDLRVTFLRGQGAFIVFNTSSFLFRRAPVCEALGFWDTVRFEADTEFIARVQWAFGRASVQRLATGPLSFQRQYDASVTAGRHTRVDAMHFGARREYLNASRSHHAAGGRLRYSGHPQDRPFAVPRMMRPDRAPVPRPFDLVIIGDLREETAEVAEALAEGRAAAQAGLRVGFVEFFDRSGALRPDICPPARAEINAGRGEMLVYGETATFRRLRPVAPAMALASESEGMARIFPGLGGQAYLPTLRQCDAGDPPAGEECA